MFVFGGLTDTNFAGYNVSRLELVEDDFKYIKNVDTIKSFQEVDREIRKKKKMFEIEKSANLDKVVEQAGKKSSLQHTDSNDRMVEQGSKKLEKSNSKVFTLRGFKAVPDPFLEIINQKAPRKALHSPAKSLNSS